MKRILFLALASVLLVGSTASAKSKKVLTEKDMGAYLFTYFSDPTHSLFMAISYDGYNFKPVNNGEPIISGDSIAEQHGIRDPHIYRAAIEEIVIEIIETAFLPLVHSCIPGSILGRDTRMVEPFLARILEEEHIGLFSVAGSHETPASDIETP